MNDEFSLKCTLCTYQFFPQSGEGRDNSQDLDICFLILSNSLLPSSNFVRKVLWVGFRFFIYFPEEFPVQVSNPNPGFCGLSNSRRQGHF